MAADEFNLARFVEAQAGLYEQALQELQAGHKRSHWMWFVFPQLVELGRSATARRYGIQGAAEAQAYLQHKVLGERLVACTQAVLSNQGRTLAQIFGSPDDLKFRSSMTLFESVAALAGDARGIFEQAIDRFCEGVRDERTLGLLGGATKER